MDGHVAPIRERLHPPGCWQEGKKSWRLVKSSISSAVCKETSFYTLNLCSQLLWKPSSTQMRWCAEPDVNHPNTAWQ